MQIAQLVKSVMKNKLSVNALLLVSRGHGNVKSVDILNVYKSLYMLKSSMMYASFLKKRKKRKLYALLWHIHAILH